MKDNAVEPRVIKAVLKYISKYERITVVCDVHQKGRYGSCTSTFNIIQVWYIHWFGGFFVLYFVVKRLKLSKHCILRSFKFERSLK